MDWFIGKDQPLQAALDADSTEALHVALQNGASINAKGVHQVTPLEYAVGHFSRNCYGELLRLHADPNQRDVEGNNAVTLATRAWIKDPNYLLLAIKAGGDPNARMPDKDPILAEFKAAHNNHAIEVLHGLGADVNTRTRAGDPLIIDAAITEDWDVVWTLLRLGAKYDYPDEPLTMADCLIRSVPTPPGAPLYNDKKLSWDFLQEHGIDLPAFGSLNK